MFDSAKMGEELSRETIVTALARLNDELKRRDVLGELCLFGGAVMVLTFQTRPTTKDVDAIFQPTEDFRRAAATVGDEFGLSADWLNDGVKGWISACGETTEAGLPQFSHVHITRPTAAYLLAMKALASRAAGPEGKGDRDDIAMLIGHLELPNPPAVFALIERFYPSQHILPKTEYLIREIFDELQATKS
jgi:hypothetical protein